MSSDATPIPPASFALAIRSLPLPNLHYKAAELRNSIAHLQYSNIELNRWADDGDRDCAEAVRENEVTIGRMEVRIGLLRKEVEGRGMRWGECEGEEKVADDEVVEGGVANGGDGAVVEERMEGRREESRGAGERNGRGTGGSLNDEELARRLREQMGEEEDGDESGVHL